MVDLLQNMFFAQKYYGEEWIPLMVPVRYLAVSVLLALLSCRGGKHRWILQGLTCLEALFSTVSYGLLLFGPNITSSLEFFFTSELPSLVGMVSLICALILGWIFWRKDSGFYQRFLPIATGALAAVLAVALFRHPDTVLQQLILSLRVGVIDYFLWPTTWVCTVAAAICLGIQLLEQMISRHAENRMRSEREALMLQGYENIRLHNQQVMMLRHDMVKHLTALYQMTDEGHRTAYLEELLGQNEKVTPVVQSGNHMLDILLNGKLSQAIAAGVRVEITCCQAPPALPLSDAELCSLVINLMDNAIAAVSAPDVEDPYLRLELRVKNDFLVFVLENAVGSAPAQRSNLTHGYGLKIVRQVLEAHGDLIQGERMADSYKTTFAIPLSPT